MIGLPRSGVRASISSKLSKAKSTAGKGITAVGRAGRQLGSSRSELEDQTSSRSHVSAYAGLGPTGTAQEVNFHTLNLGMWCGEQASICFCERG